MSYLISLQHGDRIYHSSITYGESVTFGSHKKDTVAVPEFSPSQVNITLKKNNSFEAQAKKPFDFFSENLPTDSIVALDYATRTALYICSNAKKDVRTVKLPFNAIIKIGRGKENHIQIRHSFVSGDAHIVIRCENGVFHLEDRKSTNGTFVNGKRITNTKLKSGDIISIMCVQIQLLNGQLLFYNVGNLLEINSIDTDAAFSLQSRALINIDRRYHRSPRTREQMPTEDIILANAPSKAQKFERGRGMLPSLIGTGAMFAASAAATVASPALLAARAASLISPVTSAVTSSGGDKKRKKALKDYEEQRTLRYGAYIEEQKARINAVAEIQRQILVRENPCLEDCVETTKSLRRNLWERSMDDDDYLVPRIGMGYGKLCVSVKSRTESAGFQMETEEMRDLAEQIIEETRIVDNIPARLDLKKYQTIGVVGNRARVIHLIKNMLVSLATLHCPDDTKIVGFFSESERAQWEAIRWLPHTWDANKQFRFLSFDRKDSERLCEILNEVLKERIREEKETGSFGAYRVSPYYIFLFGEKQYVEKNEIMSNLFAGSERTGVTSVFLFNDLYSLPHDCQFIVDVNAEPCAYHRSEVNSKFYFTLDKGLTPQVFDQFARAMSSIELEGFAASEGMPNGISFLEGFGASSVQELNVIERWKRSLPYKSLAAQIGVMSGGKPFALDIHEKAHGPHGLVAGTTGSGKSELLQTWILSMAIHYHPYDVSFVIIDYKGGGMANLLEPLPHVVGKITNIGANIERSLLSLKSETNRRLRLFEKYDVNHIDKYQKLYREGKTSEPLPHLIIVADEFAELKKEEPEFMAGLISIARIGRSVGVHLVLATQKPAGVVDDQIWSNSRFKPCLKVQDVGDSREMLKKPDAARITQPGRAYVQVGLDEIYELVQSYWSGAPYYGKRASAADRGNQVRIVADNGQRIKMASDEKTHGKAETDELTAVVRHISDVAKKEGIVPLPGPWLPELPAELSLEEIRERGFDGEKWSEMQSWLRIPVGKFDIPKNQQQGIQFVDFSETGHYGVYGAPSTGKTTLLKTIVMSLGLHYTPADVNIYILDCGGWSMSAFKTMPHVGGVALDFEAEKINKLEKLILDEFEQRKRKFLDSAVGSHSAYRSAVGKDIPAIVIAVDNLAAVFEAYPDLENLFVTVARDGATYGIYLVFTANGTTGVKYKVQQNINGAIALELMDKGDYASIVGRLDGVPIPNCPGRALYKGKPPVTFQAATFCAGHNDLEMGANLKKTLLAMNAAWTGPRAKQIPIMPETVTWEELAENYAHRYDIPVGFDYETVSPKSVRMREHYCMTVAGTMHTGKSQFLLQIAKMLLQKNPDASRFVLDSLNGSLSSLASTSTAYAKNNDAAAVKRLLQQIVDQLNVRKRAQNQVKADAAGDFDEAAFAEQYPLICIFVDDLKEFVDGSEAESKNMLERICRMAQHLGVLVFAAGRVADLTKYNEIESLTRTVIGYQIGIAIGGTPAMYGFFQNGLSYHEKSQEMGDKNAYIFTQGKVSKVRIAE